MNRTITLTVLICALAAPATAAWSQPARLSGMDADKDGRTSRAEYRTGLIDGSLKLDRNGDGKVQMGEMPAAARLPGLKGVIERVFRANDTSGDGALSREELAARAETRFTELDINRDGYLDAAEIKAGRRRR